MNTRKAIITETYAIFNVKGVRQWCSYFFLLKPKYNKTFIKTHSTVPD